ncbi:hypothetical protein SAMN05444050_2249 [Afipia sp. GAS231]|nr:hypothetical protein [Afipia sp. GAS231]SDN71812.1 hypothetical protein SAMN05444050_2249 [Afipia sp. GAS231]
MIKSLAALAIFAFMGVSALALPGFAPEVKANEVAALAKADRLAIHPVAGNCASQIWPNIESTCLRNTRSDVAVREARLVTAHREP